MEFREIEVVEILVGQVTGNEGVLRVRSQNLQRVPYVRDLKIICTRGDSSRGYGKVTAAGELRTERSNIVWKVLKDTGIKAKPESRNLAERGHSVEIVDMSKLGRKDYLWIKKPYPGLKSRKTKTNTQIAPTKNKTKSEIWK